jgi:hypothetical protein
MCVIFVTLVDHIHWCRNKQPTISRSTNFVAAAFKQDGSSSSDDDL